MNRSRMPILFTTACAFGIALGVHGPTDTPTHAQPAPEDLRADVCPGLEQRLPPWIIQYTLAHPYDIGEGFGRPCFPHRPPSPWNGYRTWLGLRDMGRPYNAMFNGLVWRCGCS